MHSRHGKGAGTRSAMRSTSPRASRRGTASAAAGSASRSAARSASATPSSGTSTTRCCSRTSAAAATRRASASSILDRRSDLQARLQARSTAACRRRSASCLSHTGMKAGLAERFRAIINIFRNGGEIARELIETRCQRGADIARQMRFSEAVAHGIQNLDEHWDGGGHPSGARGEAIPIYSPHRVDGAGRRRVPRRQRRRGRDAARSSTAPGTWFDPRLVAAFDACRREPAFWETLRAADLQQAIFALEPAQHVAIGRRRLSRRYRRRLCPGHRRQEPLHQRPQRPRRAVHRHDRRGAGLLSRSAGAGSSARRCCTISASSASATPSSTSPASSTPKNGSPCRCTRPIPRTILSRIAAFRDLAAIAGAHHERLDGKGYPRGLAGDEIALETRIITIADVFDALTADRPYRPAMPVSKAMKIMAEGLGTATDPDCYAALARALKSGRCRARGVNANGNTWRNGCMNNLST